MLQFGVGIYFKLTWAILIPVFLVVVFVSFILIELLKNNENEPLNVSLTK